MSLTLYNSLSGELQDFRPLDPEKVRMYSCGPTVYDYFHIGNARPFIVFDGLRRYLEFKGYDVTYVQNVTDVEDKIINRAAEEDLKPADLAQKYMDAYFKDMERLGINPADLNPKVTDYIPQIIDHVRDLEQNGYAYSVDGDVYFRVSKFSEYGKLSGRSLDELQSGSRVEIDEAKENPLDFALWKRSSSDEPGWDSPWGRGRPGWHIECSVMANETLGDTIDIHAGGQDLIFPHHENEIAQSEARTGKQFARYWLHNGLLQFEGQKMSKSLGNFEYAREVVDRHGKEPVRLFYFSTHYRKPLDFSEKELEDAGKAVARVYDFLQEVEDLPPSPERAGEEDQLAADLRDFLQGAKEAYIAEMDKDFNTPAGLSVIFELLKKANKVRNNTSSRGGGQTELLTRSAKMIRKLGRPLGLFQEPAERSPGGKQEELLQLLIDVRSELRNQQHWELADEIRARLSELGVELKDKGDSTTWVFRNAS